MFKKIGEFFADLKTLRKNRKVFNRFVLYLEEELKVDEAAERAAQFVRETEIEYCPKYVPIPESVWECQPDNVFIEALPEPPLTSTPAWRSFKKLHGAKDVVVKYNKRKVEERRANG